MLLNESLCLRILLVEDNPVDVRITREALGEQKESERLRVVENGEDAMKYLRRKGEFTSAERPDLILLDLNLPVKDGREVLREVKSDPHLRHIPVVVLTTSDSARDICDVYSNGGNCYVTKPTDLNEYFDAVKGIEHFWTTLVRMPVDC